MHVQLLFLFHHLHDCVILILSVRLHLLQSMTLLFCGIIYLAAPITTITDDTVRSRAPLSVNQFHRQKLSRLRSRPIPFLNTLIKDCITTTGRSRQPITILSDKL
jgi:hypothetical protein